MPELPDVLAYLTALEPRVTGRRLERVSIAKPFVLRTAEPPPGALEGKRVVELRRIGKRIALGLDGDLWAVIHLMIAGRLRWRDADAATPPSALASLTFETGTLVLTEAGSKRRASLHVVKGSDALRAFDAGGIDPLACDAEAFRRALTAENRTLKRALTDPRILSGIGNAYSDEILHAAKLSPVLLASKLDASQWDRLFEAVRHTLELWIDRLGSEARRKFPSKVTAFRPEMAVHGRFGKPCPRCGAPIQRIRYADNETDYCPRCQTDGKILADRSLSRLLKNDFPRTLEELESLQRRA